jgi:hypothetical protein
MADNSQILANVGTANRPTIVRNTILNVHPAYEIELIVKGAGDDPKTVEVIKTFLPENFSMQFGSSWDTPYDKSFAEQLAAKGMNKLSGLTEAITNITGAANRSKFMTAMVWKSGQPLSLSFPFVFAATSNTEKDVLDKFRFLSKLVTPKETESGLLKSPGPTIAGQLRTLEGITIECRVGNFIYLDNVIVESVDSNIDFILDKNGKPMYMTINIAIKTFYTLTKSDIDDMLDRPQLTANGVVVSAKKKKSTPTLVDSSKVAAEVDTGNLFLYTGNTG